MKIKVEQLRGQAATNRRGIDIKVLAITRVDLRNNVRAAATKKMLSLF